MNRIYEGFNTQSFVDFIRGMFYLNVFADEEPEKELNPEIESKKEEPEEPESVLNYEDLIAKARKEERDKLYGKIQSLKDELTKMTKKHNDSILLNAKKDNEISDLRSQLEKNETDVVKDLKSRIKELEEQVKGIIPAESIEKQLREELEAEYSVKEYRLQKLSDLTCAQEGFIPELITGFTKEEIDASIEKSKQRYSQIINSKFVSSVQPTQPNSGKLNITEIDLEEFSRLDPRTPEYAEMRKKIFKK